MQQPSAIIRCVPSGPGVGLRTFLTRVGYGTFPAQTPAPSHVEETGNGMTYVLQSGREYTDAAYDGVLFLLNGSNLAALTDSVNALLSNPGTAAAATKPFAVVALRADEDFSQDDEAYDNAVRDQLARVAALGYATSSFLTMDRASSKSMYNLTKGLEKVEAALAGIA
jgi:hypothetical protein